MFSKACEYGLKAMISISASSSKGERVNLKEISGAIESPEQFTAKILQQLTRAKLINSVQGSRGGFEIPKDRLEKIRLIDVVRTIDGDKVFTGCGLGLDACNAAKPCPIHNEFAQVRDGLARLLNDTNLMKLSNDLNKGLTFLHR